MIQILKWIVRFLIWFIIAAIVNKILFYHLAHGQDLVLSGEIVEKNTLPILIIISSAFSSLFLSFASGFWRKIKYQAGPFLYFIGFWFIEWFINKLILLFNWITSFDMNPLVINLNTNDAFIVFTVLYALYIIFVGAGLVNESDDNDDSYDFWGY